MTNDRHTLIKTFDDGMTMSPSFRFEPWELVEGFF
jgi:hypothetical protein